MKKEKEREVEKGEAGETILSKRENCEKKDVDERRQKRER